MVRGWGRGPNRPPAPVLIEKPRHRPRIRGPGSSPGASSERGWPDVSCIRHLLRRRRSAAPRPQSRWAARTERGRGRRCGRLALERSSGGVRFSFARRRSRSWRRVTTPGRGRPRVLRLTMVGRLARRRHDRQDGRGDRAPPPPAATQDGHRREPPGRIRLTRFERPAEPLDTTAGFTWAVTSISVPAVSATDARPGTPAASTVTRLSWPGRRVVVLA
jgi:hypothetical protein